MLIQAYDFWHLFQTDGCELQMGGSDQWGNITAGTRPGGQAGGAGGARPGRSRSSPRPRGAKFGKSEGGNVWLDPERTSPYHFYQFWLNTDDRDVERYLKLFTFLRLDRIAATMAEHAADPGRREAQRMLAREVTATVHGDAAAEAAIQTSAALFGGSADGRRSPAEALADMPERRVSRAAAAGRAAGGRGAGGERARELQGRRPPRASRARASISTAGRSTTWSSRLGEDALQGPPEERFVILRKGKKNYVRLVLGAVERGTRHRAHGTARARSPAASSPSRAHPTRSHHLWYTSSSSPIANTSRPSV